MERVKYPSVGKFLLWLESKAVHRPLMFVYHYGMLASDRGQMLTITGASVLGGLKWVPCEEVEALAQIAWQAMERGEVLLTQRKHDKMWYEYIAVRCTARKRRRDDATNDLG